MLQETLRRLEGVEHKPALIICNEAHRFIVAEQLRKAGDDCAVAESVKAASDIYAPVSGEIVAVNDALSDSPELVNSEPYEGGWIFKIKASDEAQVAALLDATAYEALLEDE
jgi:glycine cleavage system H protein